MNTVQCPCCKQTLEGNFQRTDTVKCPACETTFIPDRVFQKMNTVQCPCCKPTLEGNFQRTDTVKCPACETTFIPDRVFQSQVNTDSFSRDGLMNRQSNMPETTTWVAAIIVGGDALLLGWIFLPLLTGESISFAAERALGFFVGNLPKYVISLFFAWKLYRGKAWARTALNILLPLQLAFSIFTISGSFAGCYLNSSIEETPLTQGLVRAFSGLIITIVRFGLPLILINLKPVRIWLVSHNVENVPRYQWWQWAVLFYLTVFGFCIIALK